MSKAALPEHTLVLSLGSTLDQIIRPVQFVMIISKSDYLCTLNEIQQCTHVFWLSSLKPRWTY